MNRLKKMAVITSFVTIACMPVWAGDFDGTRNLLCASMDVIECNAGENCQKVTPESIKAPKFIKINFQDNTVSNPSSSANRPASKIERMEQVDGKLILQGAEDGEEDVRDGLGWTIAIAEDTGNMVVTASGDQVGFVVFGACIPQ